MNIKNLLDMGGYGIYVWPAYAITLIVFAINVAVTFRENHQIKKIIKKEVRESSL